MSKQTNSLTKSQIKVLISEEKNKTERHDTYLDEIVIF